MSSPAIRPFLRYLSLLAIMIAISWVAIPCWLHLDFPRQPGPEFDPLVRTHYIKELNKDKPDIAIIGDSTMRYGVDLDMLSELTGKKITSIGVPGSSSAFWYLVIKNNLVLAEHRPDYVIIVFRDTLLTAPGFRVHGGYLVKMDEYAAQQEPVLLERAYLNQMGQIEKWAEQYFPLYGARNHIRKKIDSQIRYTSPGWLLGCNQQCVEDGMSKVFITADLEPGQLRDALASAEKYLYTPAQLDFQRQVNRSFLPEMIRLTKDRGIQLVVVRMKSEMKGAGNSDASAIRQYVADLSEYLDEQGVIFLDYGRDPKFGSEYFKDAIHLNTQGKTLFTQTLAEGLNEVLK
jgi:hypothetical protein